MIKLKFYYYKQECYSLSVFVNFLRLNVRHPKVFRSALQPTLYFGFTLWRWVFGCQFYKPANFRLNRADFRALKSNH